MKYSLLKRFVLSSSKYIRSERIIQNNKFRFNKYTSSSFIHSFGNRNSISTNFVYLFLQNIRYIEQCKSTFNFDKKENIKDKILHDNVYVHFAINQRIFSLGLLYLIPKKKDNSHFEKIVFRCLEKKGNEETKDKDKINIKEEDCYIRNNIKNSKQYANNIFSDIGNQLYKVGFMNGLLS